MELPSDAIVPLIWLEPASNQLTLLLLHRPGLWKMWVRPKSITTTCAKASDKEQCPGPTVLESKDLLLIQELCCHLQSLLLAAFGTLARSLSLSLSLSLPLQPVDMRSCQRPLELPTCFTSFGACTSVSRPFLWRHKV